MYPCVHSCVVIGNRPDDEKTLRARASTLKDTINKLMFDPKAGTFCDGICAQVPHTAFHSAVYVLVLVLVTFRLCVLPVQ